MSHPLAAYLAQDRRDALARGAVLPEQVEGTVLLADLSGFTPLTEALYVALGAHTDAEALSQQINQIYSALVAQVERWRGSVISFAGGSLTCWFDQSHGPATARAAACALAQRQAMAGVNRVSLPSGVSLTLGLKVALASGPALRLAVGEPGLQLFDALAGPTLTRVTAIKRWANPGEILLDQASAAALGQNATLGGWRDDPAHAERYARLADLAAPPAPDPWPVLPPDTPSTEHLRPWLLPAIVRRYQDGLGDLPTELRPAVGMFIRCVGIDDRDPQAGPKLDALTRAVQQALARYAGALLQLTTGDQGGWFYAAFGAPIAHEDDLARAVLAALEIQQAVARLGGLEPPRIGIRQGTLVVGVYGAATRQTYAALGDEVSLAARLMTQAAPGETLLSGRGEHVLVNAFVLEPRAPIRVKGKPEPLPVMAVLARRQRRAMRLEEPAYALPMVGRADEVRWIGQVLDEVAGGAGRMLAITGEAGLGKSRLVAELVRLARQRGFPGYGSACLAIGVSSPYLVWEGIWRAFFDIDPESPARKQARVLEGALEDLAPKRAEALPLLGPLVGLSLPDNDFTRTLQPEDRRGALHALLRDCLTAAAQEARADGAGLLLVLEDLHWIDAASLQLLGDLAETIAGLPLLLVLTYRPAEQARQPLTRLETLPFFSTLALDGLAADSSEDLIRAKLAQLFPARKGALPPALLSLLTERAQGNPFFLEELLNYLHDRAIDPYNLAAVAALELPESLYSLVLSRLDQLGGQQQALLKMASVIGRRFPVAWLHGAFASQRPLPELEQELAALAHTDLIAREAGEQASAYLFKHIVTQQVAYESLSGNARPALHERLAVYLEAQAGADLEPLLDLLAYHYDRSANRTKQRDIHWMAGTAAARRYANDTAIAHFSQALALTPEHALAERFDLLLERAQVYAIIADRPQQAADIDTLLGLARQLDDPDRQLKALYEQIGYGRQTFDAALVIQSAQTTIALAQAAQRPVRSIAYSAWAAMLTMTGQRHAAAAVIAEGLRQAEAAHDRGGQAELLEAQGFNLFRLSLYRQARAAWSGALAIWRELRHRYNEAYILSCLVNIAVAHGFMIDHQAEAHEALHLARLLGNRYLEGFACSVLGMLLLYQGDFDESRAMLERSLGLLTNVNNLFQVTIGLLTLGLHADQIGEYEQALAYQQQAVLLAERIGDRAFKARALCFSGLSLYHLGSYEAALSACAQAQELAVSGTMSHELAFALALRGMLFSTQGALEQAQEVHAQALQLRQQFDQQHIANEPAAGLAQIALLRYQQTGEPAALDTALAYVEQILPHLERWNLPGTLDPLWICLVCYEVLDAAEDARAARVLEQAHAELLSRAATISDQTLRAGYLARPAHARISALYRDVRF